MELDIAVRLLADDPGGAASEVRRQQSGERNRKTVVSEVSSTSPPKNAMLRRSLWASPSGSTYPARSGSGGS